MNDGDLPIRHKGSDGRGGEETVIQQVIVYDNIGWQKWPGTNDRDFSDICAQRDVSPASYEWEGHKFRVESRFLPAYKAFVDAGEDPPLTYQWIDNTKPPSQRVIDAMVALLEEYAKECPVILWDHALNCYPSVAQHLRRLFRLALLAFADDCPGSSEIKTFPVAEHFDALYYQMKVWDFKTGVLTADKYREIAPGLKLYHKGQNESAGLFEGLANILFDVNDKVSLLRRGVYPAIDVAFVGYRGWFWRKEFCDGLNAMDDGGLTVRLHGTDMRHGELDGRWAPNPGLQVGKLYANSLFGPNPQVSSIFNGRLMDLWRCGVVQLIHDPYNELVDEGFEPWVHYVPFDGTADDAMRLVHELKPQKDKLADMIHAAAVKVSEYQTIKSTNAVYARIYGEHMDQIENGRK